MSRHVLWQGALNIYMVSAGREVIWGGMQGQRQSLLLQQRDAIDLVLDNAYGLLGKAHAYLGLQSTVWRHTNQPIYQLCIFCVCVLTVVAHMEENLELPVEWTYFSRCFCCDRATKVERKGSVHYTGVWTWAMSLCSRKGVSRKCLTVSTIIPWQWGRKAIWLYVFGTNVG